eukprot:scaffold1340_cov122-Cylindrotheca_fusiformis.AAC.3
MAKGEVEEKTEEHVEELVVDILDGSGVFRNNPKDEEDSWNRLSDALDSICNKLQGRVSDAVHYDQQTIDADSLILEIEETAQEIRHRVSVLFKEIEELPPSLQLCQNLESSCPQLRPLTKSLMDAVCQQRWIANDILFGILQTLEGIHATKVEQIKAIANFRLASKHLPRCCIRRRDSPWKDALLLLGDTSSSRSLMKAESPKDDSDLYSEAVVTSDYVDDVWHPQDDLVVPHGGVLDFVENFAAQSQTEMSQNTFMSVLVVGSEGSGKTYCCNEIEKIVGSRVKVIRPSLPYDVMGENVGATEDLLVSIMSCSLGTTSSSCTKPTIIILDDIETIFGSDYDDLAKSMADPSSAGSRQSREPHVTARSRSTMCCLVDQLRNKNYNGDGGKVLLVCTSKMNLGKSIGRFDRIFTLSSPSKAERGAILSQHLQLFENSAETRPSVSAKVENLALDLVDCTSGLSYAELAQYCRQAVVACHRNDVLQEPLSSNESNKLQFLNTLKQELQQSTPESLRHGISADFVDMAVLSAKDLEQFRQSSSSPAGTSTSLPLYGTSIETAWQELMRTIVMPICRVGELQSLMDRNGVQGGKTFTGGAILTGDPGCGKTALAYHAAAIASMMNPSIKLVDVNCTSLISKEVGSSERSMRRLFEAARAAAPCILLMDGIETVAAVRGNDNTTEGTMDRVLSTLLTELDGVDSMQYSQENPACLAIIGITHNADWIDPSLLRPGRLGKVIHVGRPEHEGRKKIVFEAFDGIQYAENKAIIDNGYDGWESLAEFVAKETEGFTGASIIGVCDEAKMLSSRTLHGTTDALQAAVVRPEHVLAAIKSRRGGM